MMTTPQFAYRSLILFALMSLAGFQSCKDTGTGMDAMQPNVILVITDDQGYGDIGSHGNPWINTPNLDVLRAESTFLTDFHVSPTCAPTRAALLTGHYANRTGVWHTVGGRSLLRETETTMAEVFLSNGYATGIFGKWHLGDNYPFRPQDRGFQEVLIHGAGGVGQGPDYWDNDYFNDTYYHNGQPKKFEGYCTDVWFREAVKFIDENRRNKKPFFCYLATNAPHAPYYVEERYASPYRENDSIPAAAFYGMIANFDENLGNLLEYLRENDLEENTVFVFMTDNGTSGGVRLDREGHRISGYNAGMRGRKGSMYEGGHRVPFFIRWPQGDIKAGREVSDLTAHIDILPTFVDMLNLKLPHKHIRFDGISLRQILTGESDSLPKRSVITDSQRIEQPEKWRQSSVMQGPWRLINGIELYDIRNDPAQGSNLAQINPEKVAELRRHYEEWWEDIAPVFPESPAIALCSSAEPVTVLRSHDMHMDPGADIVPWDQNQIRQGKISSGWYVVKVSQPGSYRFTLLRWPPETGLGLHSTLPALDAVAGTTVGRRPEGVDLRLTDAGVSLDDMRQEKRVNRSHDNVSFTFRAEAGIQKLRAWFRNDEGKMLPAYYVKVQRVEN